MTYAAPVKDLLFCITELAGLDQVATLPGFEDAGIEKLPRFMVYNPFNAWGRQREVPAPARLQERGPGFLTSPRVVQRDRPLFRREVRDHLVALERLGASDELRVVHAILSGTHVRFFTRRSAIEIATIRCRCASNQTTPSGSRRT